MKLEYTILKGNSFEKLVEEVELKIQEGWVPQGGISVANGTNFIFAQAMIRKSE